MNKLVVCVEGVPNFLTPMQQYEVLAEREKFYLVHYKNNWKGWWSKSRFEEVPQEVLGND